MAGAKGEGKGGEKRRMCFEVWASMQIRNSVKASIASVKHSQISFRLKQQIHKEIIQIS